MTLPRQTQVRYGVGSSDGKPECGQAFGSFGGLGRSLSLDRKGNISAIKVKTPKTVEVFSTIDEVITRLDNLVAKRASGNTNKSIVNEIVEMGDLLLNHARCVG